MSGPEYPHGPSSAIGGFVIGVSPIGGQNPFDVWTTIISQYANSDVLTRLITDFSQYLDQTKNMDDFFDMMWNVDTAQGYGLDVWGRIVGVIRTISVTVTEEFFAFEEAGDADDNSTGWDIFFSGASLTNLFALSDAAFRVLIFAKALSNISDGSIKSINQLLLNLFPLRGNCYVTDGQNMTMTYTFNFPLAPFEVAILESSGVLPKPVGVAATVVQGG